MHANFLVHSLSLFRRCRLAGADRPNGLIGHDHTGKPLRAQYINNTIKLGTHHDLGVASFTLREGLTHTQYRRQAGVKRCQHLCCSHSVGFAEQAAPLGMPDDDPRAADIQKHGRTHFTGVGPVLESTEILPANSHRSPPEGSHRLSQVWIRRAHHHVDTLTIAARSKPGEQRGIALEPTIHLPVSDNQLFPHLEHQSQIVGLYLAASSGSKKRGWINQPRRKHNRVKRCISQTDR